MTGLLRLNEQTQSTWKPIRHRLAPRFNGAAQRMRVSQLLPVRRCMSWSGVWEMVEHSGIEPLTQSSRAADARQSAFAGTAVHVLVGSLGNGGA
ncbi:MAG: hypothetical protein AAF307_11035 [Pseudomonadota bacterium]